MANTKVSVIIPVYNAKNYIEKTLNSILNQSIDSLEIIVINDGSTDGSKDILDYYDNTHDNIKVIHQKNKGVSAARNLGILSSTGEYIGFVDSDDLLDKKMYESMYKKAISYNADIKLAKEILLNLANSDADVLQEEGKAPMAVVENLGESSVDMMLRVWTPTDKYWDVKFRLNEAVKLSYDEAGIEIPFNQLDVHLINS